MKFTAREDIEAPIERVFAELSDFDGFERAALRRGAEVTRVDSLTHPGPGMRWAAQFTFRNRRRKAEIELVALEMPNGLSVTTLTSGVETVTVVDLVALSRQRTRMEVGTELMAHTIPARLMLQSMRLARASLTGRFRKRVADFAIGIEERYQG